MLESFTSVCSDHYVHHNLFLYRHIVSKDIQILHEVSFKVKNDCPTKLLDFRSVCKDIWLFYILNSCV